jgi:hypothetical protein
METHHHTFFAVSMFEFFYLTGIDPPTEFAGPIEVRSTVRNLTR